MATALTIAGENLIALKQAQGQVLTIDKFILANIPGIDPSQPVPRDQPLPATDRIVHEHDIPADHRGYVNPNQVVYSMLLSSDVGNFTFNWVGLYSSEDETLIAVTHLPPLEKYQSDPAHHTLGNNLVRNIMLEFTGAQGTTNITVSASTWQIDFTARLNGIDERERLSNRDIYGNACFFNGGYLVVNESGTFSMQPGTAYVQGIRIELLGKQIIDGDNLPKPVYLDVSLQPQDSDMVAVAIPVYADKADYVDSANSAHYLTKIADIAVDGTVTDCRDLTMGSVVAAQDELHTLETNLTEHLTDSANPHDVTLDQTVQADPTLGHGVREPYAVIADADTPTIDLTARNRFVWTLGADRVFPLLAPTDQGEWHFNVYPSGHTLTLDAGWDGQVVGSPDPAASMTRLALVHDGVSVTLFVDNRRA